jgi:hypothetical protein
MSQLDVRMDSVELPNPRISAGHLNKQIAECNVTARKLTIANRIVLAAD